MLDIRDIVDPEILERLTPAARNVVTEIYTSLMAYKGSETGGWENDLYAEAVQTVFDKYGIYGIANLLADYILDNFEEAIVDMDEYSYDLFRDRMYLVVNRFRNDYLDSLRVTVSKTISSKSIAISLDREKAFGSPDRYISAARKVAKSKRPPELRSRSWKILYLMARSDFVPVSVEKKSKKKTEDDLVEEAKLKYQDTISKRLGIHLAAGFWYFLEHGNIGFRDAEGTPFPAYQGPPLGFIRKSILQVEELLNKEILKIYNNLKMEKISAESKEAINIQLNNMIDGILDGYGALDKDLIRTSIRIGEELKQRLVVTRSKRFGVRIGVRKL